MKRLNLTPDLSLTVDQVATRTICLIGKGGSGKTNAEVVLAEEFHRNNVPTCIFDPAGIHYGIKSGADGKSPGLPFYVFGGLHADLPLYPENGVILANLFLDKGISMVLDVQPWSGREKARFITDFCNQLYKRGPEKAQRGSARHLIIEEIQEFLPQVPMEGEQVMVGTLRRLYTVGRNFWYGFTGASRRPAKVNKDFTEEATALIALQVSGPKDKKAISAYLEDHADQDARRQVMSELASLGKGEAFVYLPDDELLRKVQIRYRHTFDTSRTEVGAIRVAKPVQADVDVEALKQDLAAAVEKAKLDDPAELKRQVLELRRQLTSKKTETHVEQHVREVQVRVDVPVLKDGQLARLEKALERGAEIAKVIQSGLADLAPVVAKAAQPSIKTPLHQPGPMPAVSRRPSVVATPRSLAPGAAQGKEQSQGPGTLNDPVAIGQGERKVLAVLAQWPDGRTPKDLAFLAGYSAKASTIGVILSKLRQAGLVEPASKGQPVRATEAGLARAGGAEELPTGPALLEHWMGHPRIGEGERKVLRTLIEAYPDALTHEELCERTNYSPIASTMGVILSKLRKLGLVEAGARRIPSSLYEAITENVA